MTVDVPEGIPPSSEHPRRYRRVYASRSMRSARDTPHVCKRTKAVKRDRFCGLRDVAPSQTFDLSNRPGRRAKPWGWYWTAPLLPHRWEVRDRRYLFSASNANARARTRLSLASRTSFCYRDLSRDRILALPGGSERTCTRAERWQDLATHSHVSGDGQAQCPHPLDRESYFV